MDKPAEHITITGDVNSSSTTKRSQVNFHIRPHASDSGLLLYTPNDYWINLELNAAKRLAAFILEWTAYNSERFKPQGWRLINTTTGESRKVEGKVVLLGDSFVVQNPDGDAISEALPALDWRIEPFFEATP